MSAQGSLYFEDFAVGRAFTTAGRTITESDVIAFAGLSGDFSSLHMDQTFAEQGPFGRRIAHGLCSVTVFSGLFVQLGLWDSTAIAVLSTCWTFRAPVFLGDTIHGEIRVATARETKNPERGIVEFAISLVNQDGGVVQEGTWVQMFLRRTTESQHVLTHQS